MQDHNSKPTAAIDDKQIESVREVCQAMKDGRWLALSSADDKFIAETFLHVLEHWNSASFEINRQHATIIDLEADCETWRKTRFKLQKQSDTIRKAFAAYIRARCHRTVMEDDAVDEIIADWVENEELPL